MTWFRQCPVKVRYSVLISEANCTGYISNIFPFVTHSRTGGHCLAVSTRASSHTVSRSYAEVERKLAAERKRAHGELANQILGLGSIIQSETLSYIAFQKNFGKSVKVRAPGMFVEQLRRKAESAGGKLINLHTWSLKLSQYDHTTQTCTKKPLSQRWHVLGDGSGVVQRDIYSAFLARCVMGNTHHLSHLETMCAAQKPVLLQTG